MLLNTYYSLFKYIVHMTTIIATNYDYVRINKSVK